MPNSPYIWTPSGWDDGWEIAKANAGQAPVRLQLFGDSIAAGVASSYQGSLSEQLRGMLVQRFGLWGDYWPGVYGWTALAGIPWSPGQNGATFAYFQGEGYGPWWFSSNLGANAIQTFTSPYPCTALDLIYYDSFAAAATTWKYSLDGGAAQTVTNAANGAIKRISFSGLANTTHTIAWGWQSASASAAIMGAAVYATPSTSIGQGGRGLAFTRIGASGTGLQDFTAASWAVNYATSGFPMGADLALFALGTNDINNASVVATAETNLVALCHALRKQNPNCSLLFLIPSYPWSVTDDVNSGFINQTVAYQYHDLFYRASERFDAAVVDIHRKWGGRGNALGFLPANDLHPTLAGQADLFASVQGLF